MNTADASVLAQTATVKGNRHRVFDWVKAANLLKELKPESANAGLQSDMEWTGGTIWADGKPVLDGYTYLASNWATPILEIDNLDEIECWSYMDDCSYKENTKWPQEALDIINGK